ncbi:MAG: hypothetical protein QOD93_3888 [Acetobacteraceae bacterium]|jgi:hypothetical protein|nr:hypothetical protein [Acetobacteraceae bacterium]
MSVTDTDALAPIYRLLALAQSDTGQARRAANFLLSWWNAQNCGGFDLTDLWAVDRTVADDMLALAALVLHGLILHDDTRYHIPVWRLSSVWGAKGSWREVQANIAGEAD